MRANCVLPDATQTNNPKADSPLPSGAYFFAASGPLCAGRNFTGAARAVYLALACAFNRDEGCAWLSNRTMATQTGLSLRSVIRATKALEGAGVIRAVMRRGVRAERGRPRGERRRDAVRWSVNRGGGHGRPPRRGAYVIMAKAAVTDQQLHRNARAVLAAIGAEVDGAGWAVVAAGDLAADCGLGERTVRHWLRVLEDAGYLTVHRQAGRLSRYRLRNPVEATQRAQDAKAALWGALAATAAARVVYSSRGGLRPLPADRAVYAMGAGSLVAAALSPGDPGKSVRRTPATGVTPTRPSTKPDDSSEINSARATQWLGGDAWQDARAIDRAGARHRQGLPPGPAERAALVLRQQQDAER